MKILLFLSCLIFMLHSGNMFIFLFILFFSCLFTLGHGLKCYHCLEGDPCFTSNELGNITTCDSDENFCYNSKVGKFKLLHTFHGLKVKVNYVHIDILSHNTAWNFHFSITQILYVKSILGILEVQNQPFLHI